jgi:hypothetical protein
VNPIRTDTPEGAAAARAKVALTGRSCGDCSLCCKVMPVPEIEKPANEWCKHCRPGNGGCSIHEIKPAVCAGWYCAWMTQGGIGERWYPKLSRMVLSLAPEGTGTVLYVMVDPDYPLRWQEEPYYDDILGLAYHGLYCGGGYLTKICIGDRNFAITPKGEPVELLEHQGIWIDSELGTHEIMTKEEVVERQRKNAAA